ncbi:hypothetical protein CH255_09675 [Rhodococcus sp. 05-2255-2A2]|uniref:glycoside hydrolase family 19 protein n=1 Tax=unclassified Rhodococcus (in: high G+C Gram-positive bacteria) TaxID=192944 RepID=UPI000B9C0F0D|nr:MULTISPECIES: hypothetical protein [unclassified Rhodococcus (in: high G+C Gram-positive bacteria)]OZE11902.1 hypothetical protein CH250_09405 [Rhodococcus sp. 05-2255-3C]OZE20504.1 hypothetical protein CH255_09675 [Rhodococcus sp. 05-2255-2A2]
MDAATLAAAMDNRVSMARYEELATAFNRALIQADCTTVLRVTMWCSQIGHESGGLKWMEEIADGSAYEGRRDLGNTQLGDGRRFKGRGPIQVTGRFNYARLSAWAHQQGYVDSPSKFVDEPTLLSQPDYGFLGAVWYWTVARNMNAFADNRDLVGATRAVNGGQNGIDDRRKFYYRALALGDALLPQEDDMANAGDVVDQLLGPVGSDGKRGWPQLGDKEITGVDKRSIVDALARIIQQNNFAIAQNDRIEKRQIALLAANNIADPTVKK